MRVIAGDLKGREIAVPKNFRGRPTTGYAREGLFNVLNNHVSWQDIKVLDLFAGTGAFGIECFSRGAKQITAVEIQPLHHRFIQDNFRNFEMKHARVVRDDVFRFIEKTEGTYDLIFADPPFDLKELETLPQAVLNSGLLGENALFVLEHGDRKSFDGVAGFLKKKEYSNVVFSFFSLSH